MNTSIGNAITTGAETLKAAGIEAWRMDAGSLMAHVLDCDRAFLIAHSDEPLADEQRRVYQESIARRAAGEPLQYITVRQDFFALEFAVTPDVLIPRPETELIVEMAIAALQGNSSPRLADICTGSGCIAVSILHAVPSATAIAVDLSSAALRIARQNAERHRVDGRLQLRQSDLFSDLPAGELYDLIVSNPPYVSDEEMKSLPREVRFEPAQALAAGHDGLVVIRRLLNDAPRHLRPGGQFIFEIGYGQDEAVRDLIDQTSWELVEIKKDLQGIPRTVVLRRK
jgi:release factor glutamine methyltransferase